MSFWHCVSEKKFTKCKRKRRHLQFVCSRLESSESLISSQNGSKETTRGAIQDIFNQGIKRYSCFSESIASFAQTSEQVSVLSQCDIGNEASRRNMLRELHECETLQLFKGNAAKNDIRRLELTFEKTLGERWQNTGGCSALYVRKVKLHFKQSMLLISAKLDQSKK